VKKLKKCKFFRDVTWTNIMYPDNSTQQVMHCRCPKNSVAYLVKRQAYQTETGLGYQFSFACSPQTVRIYLNAVCFRFKITYKKAMQAGIYNQSNFRYNSLNALLQYLHCN
jgi:giant-lens protein precursor (argos protein)